MIKILRAKFHDIKVTGSALDYHGSITLDPEQCEIAGIYPLEFVEIWNKCSGHRLTTYVIYGERGSKCCILNGAAARTCQVGDGLIICASEFIDRPDDILERKPVVLCFGSDNSIVEILKYAVNEEEKGRLEFNILKSS